MRFRLAAGFPRHKRRGLIEAMAHPPGARYRAGRGFPRHKRRGLIEAASGASSMYCGRCFPGTREIAEHSTPAIEVFPGTYAGASSKPRVAAYVAQGQGKFSRHIRRGLIEA
jgi:hypothetical protein